MSSDPIGAPALPIGDTNRLVRLVGGHNFRDLGGYETVGSRSVRWRVLYRSGKLSTLTPDDITQLAARRIHIACDLRTPEERAREPSVPGVAATLRGWDYDVGHRGLLEAALTEGATPQHMSDALAAVYAAMPWSFAMLYADAFKHLIDGDVPLVFHCTAGKDRTGILAALILRTLGVSEAQVFADYLLTDLFLDTRALTATPTQAAAGFGFMRSIAPELRAPLLRCDPAYLRRALDAIDTRHGSVLGYLDEALGIGAEGVAALQRRLLTPAH